MIDYKKLSLGIAGASRIHLQANLLRKFLNYKEEHRSNLSVGDVTMSMVRDATEVVNSGFMKAFVVLRVIGIFLCCRNRVTSETGHQLAMTQNDTVQVVTQ